MFSSCTLFFVEMWKDYITRHGKISYELYRRVFDSENISFATPSQDECEICLSYKQHSKEFLTEHDGDSCEICVYAKAHLDRARKARVEYDNEMVIDKENNSKKVFAADMQKIILLPKLTTKEHFFVSRLVTFNETFACLNNENEPDRVMLWHEAISGRSASDVACAFIKCIELSGSDDVAFWADNCVSQNKNWTLYTAMCQCVNANWGPNQITIKYLEKGHTFLKADSVHGSIGKKMRKKPEIITFQDFIDLCDEAGSNIKPVVMQVEDFRDFIGQHRTRKTKSCTLPLLSDVSVAGFRKGARSLFFKTNFDDEFQSVDFLKPKFNLSLWPAQKTQPRGIVVSKRNSIIRLLDSVSHVKKRFWLNIPTSDSVSDLVDHTE